MSTLTNKIKNSAKSFIAFVLISSFVFAPISDIALAQNAGGLDGSAGDSGPQSIGNQMSQVGSSIAGGAAACTALSSGSLGASLGLTGLSATAVGGTAVAGGVAGLQAMPGMPVADAGVRAGVYSIALSSGITATADTNTTANTTWQVFKDNFLNCIFYTISRMMLQSMVASVISWANSGFQGNPAFIQDPKAFFAGVVDQSIGSVLNISEYTSWMCTPFRLQLQRLMVYNQSFLSRSQCTLTGSLNNISGFVNSVNNQFGDAGGWSTWAKMTTIPQNNIYGASSVFNMEVNAVITGNVNIQQNILNWGRGFLDFKDPSCVAREKQNAEDNARDQEGANTKASASGSTGDFLDNCKTVTPGDVIATQVNSSLGASKDALISAKQINELVGALFAGLLTKVFSSGGLFGLGSNNSGSGGYYSGPSYVQQLSASSVSQFQSSVGLNTDQMIQNISSENRYVGAKNGSINRIDYTASTTRAVLNCNTFLLASSTATSITTEQRQVAISDFLSASSTLSKLNQARSILKRDVAIGESNIANLQQIINAISSLSSADTAALQSLMQQYTRMSTTIHYDSDAINAEYERDTTIPNQLATTDIALQNQLRQCQLERGIIQ